MKRQKSIANCNPFDVLSEELVFTILDLLATNTLDKKSFSLVCKSFYTLEAKHRRTLRPLRAELLPSVLKRYPFVNDVDLTLCFQVTDYSLNVIANACKSILTRINLSRSKFFSSTGLLSLALNCENLLELDLSNATELKDAAAASIAQARNLEKLWLTRCKLITDMGIGCIAVGCSKLKLICLKWCVGVGDLGVDLLAVKCREIRSLDLSYLPISERCFPAILRLEYLDDFVLEGCFGIDDDSLSDLKHGWRTLKRLDISSCQNISHTGLSSLIGDSEQLQLLNLAHGSPVTIALSESLRKLSTLQSIILDGCQVTCTGLKAIGNSCLCLRELSFSKCLGVTDDGLSSIVSKLTDLRKLDITCCRNITEVSIASITNTCSSLTSLMMESCTLVPKEAYILIGQRCHSLQELDLTDNEIDDQGLKSISQCSSLCSLKLGVCLNITDRGLAYVGMGCPKLRELDIYRCADITDSGISAIASGCPFLEMINMAYCVNITDGSLLSLSKCSNLKTLEIRGCFFLTSRGLASIAVRCKLLSGLDIKKCENIDDTGMIALALFSHNLKQINLSYSSVTDVGLLSLASISCLQILTILHQKGLTARGLASTLFACGCLTKVKVHASYKSLLPQCLLDHLEARGCVLQWRDKVFQAEVDPKCWKFKLEDVIQ